MFATAKSIAPAPKAKPGKDKARHEMPAVSDLAKLKALIVSATAMAAALETEIKEDGFEIFMDSKGSTRPSSIEAFGEGATCSVEFRKRGTNSALSDDEAKVLDLFGIKPFDHVVTQELYAINPKYAADGTLLGKVEKALSKIVPEDFIVKQEGVSKKVVTDAMFDEAYKTAGAEAVLRIMTTMALKPKLGEEYDMANLIDDAVSIMRPKKTAKTALPVAKIGKK